MDKRLEQLYTESKAAYSSVDRLYTLAKKHIRGISRKDVEKWLQSQDAYTLHKMARKKLSIEPKVISKGIDHQWCIDLCEMGNVSEWNDDQRYILTCIDAFSKFAWAVPVPRKTAKNVTHAFQSILNSTTRRPRRVESDRGKEFYNKQFQDLCKQIGANHFSTNSRHKSAIVERFNRTLKNLIYRHFTRTRSHRWIEFLSKGLEIYNNRYHRSIKMAPNQVNDQNSRTVYRNLYSKRPKPGKLYPVGQMVRISKVKHVFEKGYLPNYTEEVFLIKTSTSREAQ